MKSNNEEAINLAIPSLEANNYFLKKIGSTDFSFYLDKYKAPEAYKNSTPSFLDLVASLTISTYFPKKPFFSEDAWNAIAYLSLPNLKPEDLIYWRPTIPTIYRSDSILDRIKKKGSDPSPSLYTSLFPIGSYKPDELNSNRKDINIHTDVHAQNLTHSLDADAVTVGRHVFFAKGKYDPSTPDGIALLIHELTHIKQQQDKSPISVWPNPTEYISLEKEAITNERKVLSHFLKYTSKVGFRSGILDGFRMFTKNNTAMLSTNTRKESPILIIRDILHSFGLNDVNLRYGSNSPEVYSHTSKYSDFPSFSSNSAHYEMDNKNNATNYNEKLDMQSSKISTLQSKDLNSTSTIEPTALTYHTDSVPIHENRNTAVPFFAETGRQIAIDSSESLNMPDTIFQNQPVVASPTIPSIEQIAMKVYGIIERKIKMEREQRGLR